MPHAALRDGLATRDFERILIVKPSSLGDIIHALPVLRSLRRRYVRAHIAWLAAKAFAPLLRPMPDIDEVIEFDRRHYGKLGRSLAASRDFGAFLARLRREKFDLVVDLQGLFRSAFIARATGASVRIGRREARELAWLFYTHRLPKLPGDAHAVERLRQVEAVLGLPPSAPEFDLALSPEEKRKAEQLLLDHRVSLDRPFAAVLPTARWETKEWPPPHFSALVDRLAADHGLASVLLGSPDDQTRCAEIIEACRSRPANLAGRTDLRLLAAVLDRADLVICHDSGPTHIAAALGKPMVCIVGPTNPARTGPYNRPEAIVRNPVECSPCYLRRLSQCPYEHRCMRELTVETVARQAEAVLKLRVARASADK
jgi:lipopolysaccharide heptosyltransferase I